MQVCVEISGCGRGVDRSQQAAEVGEVGEAVRSGDEHACVDGAGDGGADVDGGEDRDVQDVADVACSEGPIRFLDHDDAVEVSTAREERGEREVARPAQDADPEARRCRWCGRRSPGVDDGRPTTRCGVADAVEQQRADHGHRCAGRPGESEDGGCGVGVHGGERRRLLRCAHDGERACDRGRAVAASSADHGDVASGRRRFPDAAVAREHGPKVALRPHRSRSGCGPPLQHGRARRAQPRGDWGGAWSGAGGAAAGPSAPPAGRPG